MRTAAIALLGLIWAALPCRVTASPQDPAAQPPDSEGVEARSRALHRLFADYWEDHLSHAPEEATSIGDRRRNDRWSDYSVDAIEDSLRRNRIYLQRIRAIDTTGLPEQDRLSSGLLVRILTEYKESVAFKEWEMPLNQIHGAHIDVPQLVAATPFENATDYRNYISRLHRLPDLFSQLVTDMKLGIRDGHVPPRLVAEKVLAQVNDLIAMKPGDSPFFAPATKFPAEFNAIEQAQFAGQIGSAIRQAVIPAYRRLADFIQTQYIPKARPELGVDSIPNGAAYYEFRIRINTTLDMKADQVHRIGLEEVRRDEADMLAVAAKLGYHDLKQFSAAMKTDPKLHPTSKQQVLELYRTYLGQMTPKLPQLFGTLPASRLIVEATPVYAERQKPAATYDQGSLDGKRPGRVIVNTYNFREINLGDAESIAYHEGVPGHHLQMSIAQELNGLPEFRKQYSNTAYQEGWALYSERLGKELGFYQDPYSDYGRLQSDIWRAIRLVVDTGIHSQHWTRQQVVDFFHDHSSVDETNVQRETDRYIAWPGQALGYKIGQLKLLELRLRAQTELGGKFDLKRFHDLLLGSGALPLDVLDVRVNAWIAARQHST